jgi:autotransporter-associated beta strand protein
MSSVGLRIILVFGLILINLTRTASAQNLTWDSSGSNPTAPTDGTGTWNFSSAHWSNGTTDLNWINGSTAFFGDHNGVAGTITLGVPLTAGGISFGSPGSSTYTIAGTGTNTLTLIGSTPTIFYLSGATISAGISGTNGLTVSGGGPGTLTLSGSNTYTGGTNLQSGTLTLGSSGALGTTGTITFGDGTLQFTANNTTDYSNRISNASLQNFSFDTNGQSVTLAGNLISSGGDLVKNGAGILTLTGTNNYTAGTDLHGGELSLGSSGAIPTGSLISFGGGSLQFTSANTTDYSSSFLTGFGVQYSIDTNGQAVTFASNLTSSGGTFTKFGAGSLNLTGTNTYSGGTTIKGGTLLADSSNSMGTGAVTVMSGGTLGGTGIIAPTGTNNVVVQSGGTVDLTAYDPAHLPASFTNTLTLHLAGTNSATFQAGSSFVFNLGQGGTSSELAFTGLTAATPQVFFNDNQVSLDFLSGAANGIYTLFSFDQSGAYSGTLQNGSNYTFQYNPTDITVTLAPEPAAWSYLICGLLFLWLSRCVTFASACQLKNGTKNACILMLPR